MPTNKKNSNKTAHVLNIITAGQDADSAAPDSERAVAPAAPTAAPVVEVEKPSDDLSDQIRLALKGELDSGEEPAFSALEPEVIPTGTFPASPAQQPIPPVRSVVKPISDPPADSVPVQAAPIPVQAAPVSSGAPISPSVPAPSRETPAGEGSGSAHRRWRSTESDYINIMQELVEEKAPTYIKLLGVCSCSRCAADVKALALSHLEPKYIVLHEDQQLFFNAYETRYNAEVTSQLISACRMVMAHPRH